MKMTVSLSFLIRPFERMVKKKCYLLLVGSMESHGSVVTHLLSQVKLGMDLTKVVLPTFILERRSLLEMYADFFAHPDIFVG